MSPRCLQSVHQRHLGITAGGLWNHCLYVQWQARSQQEQRSNQEGQWGMDWDVLLLHIKLPNTHTPGTWGPCISWGLKKEEQWGIKTIKSWRWWKNSMQSFYLWKLPVKSRVFLETRRTSIWNKFLMVWDFFTQWVVKLRNEWGCL